MSLFIFSFKQMLALKKEYRKFWLGTITFSLCTALLLFLLEWTLAFFVSHSNNAQTGKVNLIMNRAVDPELMIMGSSVAEVGIDPLLIEKEMQLTAYNLAIDGTALPRSEYLLDNFLDYSQNCQTILIGMAFFSLEELQEMHAPERFIAHKSNRYIKDNVKRLSPDLYAKLYRVPFYTFIAANHTYYKNAGIGLNNWYKSIGLYDEVHQGYVPRFISYEDTRATGNQMRLTISEKTIAMYRRIIQKIKNKNIDPVLVLTPMHVNGQSNFSNFTELRRALYDLSYEMNVKFFDFSEHPITQDTSFYYNNGHLNNTGAQLFTKAICDSLKSKPLTTNLRKR
ncbi:MAG TPA: hypothetical protein DDY13_14475 [Cytophagales bacterium]|jgi:hypothetical protein|nr:hypothetical protein [Cytophagales bacterium]